MNRFMTAVVAMLVLAFPAFAADVDGGPDGDEHDAKEVFAQMKSDGRLLAVFFHGSDWCEYGERIRKELWNAPAFRAAVEKKFHRIHSDWRDYTFRLKDPVAKGPALTADQDGSGPIDEHDRIVRHEAATAPVRKSPHVFPSITVMDADGRICGTIAQLENRTAAEVLAWLDEIATAVAVRDRCFRDAESLQASAKADKLAEGLAAMGRFYAPAGQNKNKIWESVRGWKEYKELRAIDPNDATGFASHMEFSGMFNEYRGKAANAATEADAIALASGLGGSKYLTSAQKQMAAFLPYYHHKKNGDREKMTATIKRALAMKVEGDERERWFAHGLEGLLCMVDAGPVSVPYGWRDEHCTGEFEWSIKTGVRRCFRLPAGYRISFHPGVGNHVRGLPRKPGGKDTLTITEVRLLVDGKPVWTTTPAEPPRIAQDLGDAAVDVRLEQSPAPGAEVELRVRGTATGKDSRGEILVTPFLELE